jgi:hypothetical protein
MTVLPSQPPAGLGAAAGDPSQPPAGLGAAAGDPTLAAGRAEKPLLGGLSIWQELRGLFHRTAAVGMGGAGWPVGE